MAFIGLSRPAARHLAPVPAVGDEAPAGRVLDVLTSEATVVAFLRHVGCPFAEATVRSLHQHAGVERVLLVSHGDEGATLRWLGAIGAPPASRVLIDPEREEYARWGLGFTTTGHFLGPASLGRVLSLLPSGIRNRAASGTRWQQAGTFALDAGARVALRHLPSHAGDLPDASRFASTIQR